MILEGENLVTSAKSTGHRAWSELATVFDNLQAPIMVVTIADRFETMATAVAASATMNIPLAHIQGGEITGSIDEKVRHAITKLADLHLVASENAAERVIRMGEATPSAFSLPAVPVDRPGARSAARTGRAALTSRRSSSADMAVSAKTLDRFKMVTSSCCSTR